jgi:hypothetical protein
MITYNQVSNTILRESFLPIHVQEKDLARRWYTLPPGSLLPLSNGYSYQLIFAGRPGGPQGPDIRDAILHPAIVGDVELHIRASDWFTHQHHRDPRYNNVILHVVLTLDDPTPSLRQDGTIIPTCCLQDISSISIGPYSTNHKTIWPCEQIMQEMSAAERTNLLRHAGLLRFEQKTHIFVEQLHNTHPLAYDTCLILSIAEGLGYGRDRAFFRAAGSYLLGLSEVHITPEPLGHTPNPPLLDAQRLHILAKLVSEWRTSSAWKTMLKAITTACQEVSYPEEAQAFVVDRSHNTSLAVDIPWAIHSLRALFPGLSTARSDILICNIVLPFAAAVALTEHDHLLFEQAQTLYANYPSLPSNQVTRAMCKQLHLHQEPGGACQQQGLHYIYQQTCREKHCSMCISGRPVL